MLLLNRVREMEAILTIYLEEMSMLVTDTEVATDWMLYVKS
jgi:hypothetical protein